MSYFTANGNITDAVSEMARELKEIEEKSAEFVVNVRKTMKELGVRMFDNNSAIKYETRFQLERSTKYS